MVLPHLHGINQLLLCVKHKLDTAMCPTPQLLDYEVLIDKHIALQDTAQHCCEGRGCTAMRSIACCLYYPSAAKFWGRRSL